MLPALRMLYYCHMLRCLFLPEEAFSTMQPIDPRLEQVLTFPQVNGLFGRRSRRFGFGMAIPSGPLTYTSQHEPLPLFELEFYDQFFGAGAYLQTHAEHMQRWHASP